MVKLIRIYFKRNIPFAIKKFKFKNITEESGRRACNIGKVLDDSFVEHALQGAR